jgi:MFS family permease
MGFATIFIAFIPDYNTIGFLAPCLLLSLRFIQGLSAGGQFSGLITIAVDENPKQKSYLVSLVLTISLAGSLLASVIGYVSVAALNHSNFYTLIWRIPFLLSGLLFLIYVWYKPKVSNAIENSEYKFKSIFKQQPAELVFMTILAATMAGIYYLVFSYSITLMREYFKISQSNSLLVLSFIMFLSLLLLPLMGKFADKSSCRIRATKNFTLVMAITIIPMFITTSFNVLLISLSVITITYCAIASYLTSMFAEIFDNSYRMTACSISYSIGGVLGSLSPLVAEYTIKISLNSFLYFVISLIAVLYLIQYAIFNTQSIKQKIYV